MSEFALQSAVAPLIACNFIYLFAQTTRNGAKSVLAYLALPEKAYRRAPSTACFAVDVKSKTVCF